MRFCYFFLISLVYLWSGMARADDPALTNNPLTLQSRTSSDLGALPAGIDYGTAVWQELWSTPSQPEILYDKNAHFCCVRQEATGEK